MEKHILEVGMNIYRERGGEGDFARIRQIYVAGSGRIDDSESHTLQHQKCLLQAV